MLLNHPSISTRRFAPASPMVRGRGERAKRRGRRQGVRASRVLRAPRINFGI